MGRDDHRSGIQDRPSAPAVRRRRHPRRAGRGQALSWSAAAQCSKSRRPGPAGAFVFVARARLCTAAPERAGNCTLNGPGRNSWRIVSRFPKSVPHKLCDCRVRQEI
ncbi:hypothetical protein CBM2626_A140315 [Cupriavidus taiwanensis]|uniref:Uncharacterized protein n=1 Tax=Cupriavidus taiwanensis TaxID=164546 RepID=A0A375DZH4_9BURK|nr:hypothetical protein CBM2615_A250057 [Cupriavidus taiwanensis]SOZ55322.1 hypothetical protein CBM2614_A220057 [Cupriavidus taiwanensis]SOZ57909.1 hypothetical protein CBM2613_A230057 [Cupriavidus taiwanensis]SOZ98218.1 hypothetical protein CBM2626_A140315 [Cupriavidus taiwanensis]SPA05087.1 hypothetical protein CBM2625_A180056 [Cupriavidus taiwanensis]